MKKLLMASVTLCLFSASLLLFQMSCKKEALANNLNVNQQNKIAYVSSSNIYVANSDGSNLHQLTITVPDGYSIGEGTPTLLAVTPDGSKLLFTAGLCCSPTSTHLYSCNTDGSSAAIISTDSTLLYARNLLSF